MRLLPDLDGAVTQRFGFVEPSVVEEGDGPASQCGRLAARAAECDPGLDLASTEFGSGFEVTATGGDVERPVEGAGGEVMIAAPPGDVQRLGQRSVGIDVGTPVGERRPEGKQGDRQPAVVT